MDHQRYERYLNEYVQTAVRESDGTARGIAERLGEFHVGRFSFHREEKLRALRDARQAFDEHRHWPVEIILKQLGVG